MKKVLVCGGGGFIGHHLIRRLKANGAHVRGIDLKYPEFSRSDADDFIIGDLRDPSVCRSLFADSYDEVYQLAADMGGAGYVFSGENDATLVHNSALINLNILDNIKDQEPKPVVFYSSSPCIYPQHNQMDPQNPTTREDSAYPAFPDSEYGWEKLFSERLYKMYERNFRIPVRIARFHNVFGPEGAWNDGREKAPAAICRKVAMAENGDEIEIWGDGLQTRSFLYIDECLDGVAKLMASGYSDPLNIGSDEMISIDNLVAMVAAIADKTVSIKHITGPLGVRGRFSDNQRINDVLGWRPSRPLREGLEKTYRWIALQVENKILPDIQDSSTANEMAKPGCG